MRGTAAKSGCAPGSGGRFVLDFDFNHGAAPGLAGTVIGSNAFMIYQRERVRQHGLRLFCRLFRRGPSSLPEPSFWARPSSWPHPFLAPLAGPLAMRASISANRGVQRDVLRLRLARDRGIGGAVGNIGAIKRPGINLDLAAAFRVRPKRGDGFGLLPRAAPPCGWRPGREYRPRGSCPPRNTSRVLESLPYLPSCRRYGP